MAGLLGYALGGALAGAGEGIVAQAQARREEARAELMFLRERMMQQEDRAYRSGEAEKDRMFRSGEAQTDRQFEMQRLADQRAFELENRQGETIVGEDGATYVRQGAKLVPLELPSGETMKIAREPKTRILSNEDKASYGLPADQSFQMDKDGKITQIGGGGTTVNVGGEKGYDKTVGEEYGKRFMGLQDEAAAARRAINALDVMEKSMQDDGFYSGIGSQSITQAKRLASAFGIKGAEGIESIEQFNAMAKQAALDVMGGSLGTGFSNADRDFVLDQVPNLQNTVEGNRALIEVQRRLAERKLEIAQQARDYASQNGGRIDAGFDDYIAGWAEKNRLFPEVTETPSRSSAGMPRVGTVEDGYRFRGGDPSNPASWERVN